LLLLLLVVRLRSLAQNTRLEQGGCRKGVAAIATAVSRDQVTRLAAPRWAGCVTAENSLSQNDIVGMEPG
jgi:hypothetical protein